MPATSVSYQNGKIYRIWSLLTDKIYIGSTADTLSNRFCSHKKDYNSWKNGKKNLTTSYTLFEEFGIDNCKIDLEHNFPCNSKQELNKEEGRVQRLYKHILINKSIAGRTIEEYREEHKEQLLEQGKQYREDHKIEIAEKSKVKYTCECGSNIRYGEKSRHNCSLKHQAFITAQN